MVTADCENPGSTLTGIMSEPDSGLKNPSEFAGTVPLLLEESLTAFVVIDGVTTALVGAISLVMSPVVS